MERAARCAEVYEGYRSYNDIADFPSQGNRTRIRGKKVRRLYQLLSNTELMVFLYLDSHEAVTNIREGFPCLSLEDTMRCAKTLGVHHPENKRGGYPVHVVTDFLVDAVTPSGEPVMVPVSVKREAALNLKDSSGREKRRLKRVMDRQLLESYYWKEHYGACLQIWTEKKRYITRIIENYDYKEMKTTYRLALEEIDKEEWIYD